MSQNKNDGASPNWWETEEYDDAGYVPGSLSSDAGPGDAGGAGAASDSAKEAARRAEASAPATQAVPVQPPVTPVSPARPAASPADPAPTAATAVISAPAAASASRQSTPSATAALPTLPQEPEPAPVAPSPRRGAQAEETLRASLESKPIFPRVLQWLVAVLTPLILLAVAVRAVASGAFLWLEYHRPGFASDAYGFTDEQRMTYGSYGLNYINSFAGPDYLGGLVVTGGARTLGEPSLFRPEEVGHMADVQALIHLLYLLAVIAAVMVIVSFLVLRTRSAGGIRRSLFAGAWVTLGLAGVLGVLGAIGWERFFTGFHEIFFSQGNWEFYMNDTLIRLYPPAFWVDAAIVLGAIVALACILLIVFCWPTRARRERAKLAQSKREFRLD